ncbi:MAG: hypothetical protein CAPSK01_004246 [Candidatus Accumulibacter vicinus]|uniref:Uncharacterized protein n=1 Tax=Candidatus Accumulibacter vicinus TaxID=2954382 RepID=A0A084XV63_9PROT|nr:MAG: hypothetical protein CAPSK01_004246 [Candidatus Accumulibacter vicinus]
MVGAIDTGRVVDCVGEYPAAIESKLDASFLRQAEVAAFADYPRLELAGIDP